MPDCNPIHHHYQFATYLITLFVDAAGVLISMPTACVCVSKNALLAMSAHPQALVERKARGSRLRWARHKAAGGRLASLPVLDFLAQPCIWMGAAHIVLQGTL